MKAIRAAIYARKSQEDPRSSDLRSTNWQIEQGKAVAADKGWTVVATLKDDAISGGSHKRSGLAELDRLIDSGAINHIIVWELSRLWRSVGRLNEFLTRM